MIDMNTQEKTVYRLLRDPTDVAAKAMIDKWVAQGKMKLEDVRLSRMDGASGMYSLWEREREKNAKLSKQVNEFNDKLEKLYAKLRVTKTRIHFREEDRELEYRFVVRKALKTGLGSNLGRLGLTSWNTRYWAIDWFRENLWMLREVSEVTLLEAIRIMHLNHRPGLSHKHEALKVLIDPDRKVRAGPPLQDWTTVRDRLERKTEKAGQ
ncbi:hypothetical protein OKW76_00365 [Sphingomonas sp. S1-29]|uniref:hypothetical protein n=1 Tax=Sphingomonas sp. S1-29 TaxID=2991074 RepID=UPI0022400920|nr:hypothetical protein [Sphingomonas sp. S1-29]UZK69578.1 hypothetical protein OKW76_00365 [Sphingomonas sp. S1-29]